MLKAIKSAWRFILVFGMNYEWTDFDESIDGPGILPDNQFEMTETDESKIEQIESESSSKVDWEHLTDPAKNVEKKEEICCVELSEDESPEPKSRSANSTSLFSWLQNSKVSEDQPTKRQRKRNFEEHVEGCSDQLANTTNCLKSRKIFEMQIDDDNDSVEEPEEPKVQPQHMMTIQGIKVIMPVKPYPCQVQVITSIVNGCNKEENCLLESPTGSGKTLALLCGALGWQSDFQKKFDEAKRVETTCQEAGTSKSSPPGKAGYEQSAGNSKQQNLDEVDLTMFDDSDWDVDNVEDYSKPSKCKRVPKIYYGSRTHRQITQVVRELKKTVYKDKRMTVLSSREFSCIQETNRSKTELCRELLDPKKKIGCPYYNERNKNTLGTYNGLYQNGVESPWDIEELVTAGRETKACPYFAARNLMAEAEIIFCPYNYLIDPAIRETLQLDVHGHIIILDEAHNMEDICREAGSVSLTDDFLESIAKDCAGIIAVGIRKKLFHQVDYAGVIENYCEDLRKFIDSTKMKPKKSGYDNTSSDQWTGDELMALFESNQMDKKKTSDFIRSSQEAIQLFNSSKEELRQGKSTSLPTVTNDSVRKLEMILMALNMVMSPKYAIDYRVVVKEDTIGFKKVRSLEFVCMNPGVIFSPLSAAARTIILASGTLAPTSSFAGELGVKFPLTIQANHVTPRSQICVKCVGQGPNGTPLKATYQNLNQWDFQDGVGSVVLSVCEAVPHGVLVFFSSYGAMNILITRWQSNKVMKKIAEIKTIFQETRGSGDLTSMMANYRETIRNTSNEPVGKLNGAVLFAVFRGKVAEGIDFSDNEARAVLTIGIPFAVRNDPAVDMKCRYNDANKSKGLLAGHDWYTIQAFRALNQALGRAIRHKNDWGAIILIDQRLTENRYGNYLPRWIQSVMSPQKGPQPDISQCLREFVARQKKRDNES